MLRQHAGRLGETALLMSVGVAAVRIQDVMRRHLEAMIYSQPPAASGYQRTRTLYRSAHASPPGVNHSGDEARAAGGADLAATAARAAGRVSGSTFGSEVGSWISYADFVEQGINQPSPRPFVEATEQEAGDIMTEEMTKYAERVLRFQ